MPDRQNILIPRASTSGVKRAPAGLHAAAAQREDESRSSASSAEARCRRWCGVQRCGERLRSRRRAFEPVGGSFDFALVERERAEIDRGLGVVRRDGQSFAEATLGFLHVTAGLLRVAEIVEDFGAWVFLGRFCEKVYGFLISAMEALRSCQGRVGWGHGSSAIAGSDRPVSRF